VSVTYTIFIIIIFIINDNLTCLLHTES